MGTSNEEAQADALAARERLVALMVAQIIRQGFYLTQIRPQPTQGIIDLRWAAQIAGRDLGRRTRTYASAVGRQRPGMVTVVVAPVETQGVQETQLRDNARIVIESLQTERAGVRTRIA